MSKSQKSKSQKPKRVKPRLSRGLRDLLPQEMLARQWMVDRIREVYELYGFVPIATPAIEYLDVLLGPAGEEVQKAIFYAVNPEEEDLGLRFDLTVPLARVMAQYRDLPRPFRRYQVASVWRADKPDPGRFREFTQFDLDSVGVVSEIADTEILAGMCDTMEALGVERYRVRYSSRNILNLLLSFADIPGERGADVFRVLDKLEKIGLEKVRLELTSGYKDRSGDIIPGLGFSSEQVNRIEAFLALQGSDRKEAVDQVRDLFRQVEGADEAIGEVETISRHLYALGYGDDRVALDLSIARGLEYYTGPVFETELLDAPRFGSVFSGGRYDGLVERFLGEKVPATGASIGVDRLLAALVHLGRISDRRSTAQVLVTRMDNSMDSDYLELAYELRRAGIRTELYLGKVRSVGKQLKYADQCGVPIALLYGTDEKASEMVTLKDLEAGGRASGKLAERQDWLAQRPGQRQVPRAELVATVRKMLDDIEASEKARLEGQNG